jgi:N-acetylmuramoyl-L-alanine amidase
MMHREAGDVRSKRSLWWVVLVIIGTLIVVVGVFSYRVFSEQPTQNNVAETLMTRTDIFVVSDVIEIIEEIPAVPISDVSTSTVSASTADELYARLDIKTDIYPDLQHGTKTAPYQKYIVLHDTEGTGSPTSVIDWWESNGNLIAAHFVVGRDGTIVQAVPLDKIAHHAGFGDTSHGAYYGVTDESRDDKKGTTPIGSWASAYGMNSYSIGIELVHVGDGDGYPEAQLKALDGLIAYIDAYYGSESTIIDHKAWRSGNSDTSPEFATYLSNYQKTRNHSGTVSGQ